MTNRWHGVAAAALLGAAAIVVGIVSSRPQAATAAQPPGEKLARQSDCFSCHSVELKLVGPSFAAVAERYRGQPDAVARLMQKIRAGGSGVWGTVAMIPHPAMSPSDLREIVKWVLSVQVEPATAKVGSRKTYRYALPGGGQASLDFPVFGKGHQVTAGVFSGWEQFNSYCFRCHGTDASGSAYAPDLRHSLAAGMTRDQFIAIAMAGRVDKGMPSWAGFFSPQQLDQIYDYVKGRSLGLVKAGRPESAGG